MSLSSPGHAVSLFRRQPFWEGFWVRSRGFARRDAQTQRKVPTVYFEGNWRCKLRPKAAKPPFFIDFLDATFDIEDHSNAGRKTVSLSSPGHAVSLFRRQPFWEGFWVRSRGFARRDAQTQRKVPTVYFEGNWRCKLRPKAAKPPFFIDFLDATFDIEDHSNAGRKTVSLSSPGHAVSLFRRQPFWEGFWVRSRGFARRDAQTQRKVPTVYFEGNWRCKLRPTAAKTSFFFRFWTRRLTLKLTPTQLEKRCH